RTAYCMYMEYFFVRRRNSERCACVLTASMRESHGRVRQSSVSARLPAAHSMTQSLIAFAALHLASMVILLTFAALERTWPDPAPPSQGKLRAKAITRAARRTRGQWAAALLTRSPRRNRQHLRRAAGSGTLPVHHTRGRNRDRPHQGAQR